MSRSQRRTAVGCLAVAVACACTVPAVAYHARRVTPALSVRRPTPTGPGRPRHVAVRRAPLRSAVTLKLAEPDHAARDVSTATGAQQWLRGMRECAGRALVACAALLLPAVALAENELAAQCGGKFDSSLVDRQCFVNSCRTQTQACLENSDCMKGLVCTARCLGDTKCISGCFARFGNPDIDGLIKCSIEDEACIKVAILPPGPDAPNAVPKPPKPVVADFSPRSLEGKWYKVMGWNSMYDCYDCQQNRFSMAATGATAQAPPAASVTAAAPAAAVRATPVNEGRGKGELPVPMSMAVDVDFDMPRPAKLLRSGHNHQHLREVLDFDPPGSTRTAHTHGNMFGLSFWENWYLIGENKPGEPQFKFVYYTGRTVQNTYDGAFVYARTPDVPSDALESIYTIAREAGFDPSGFCRVRNSCGVPTQLGPELIGVPGVLADTPGPDARSLEPAPTLPSNPLVLSSLQIWYELTDYLEDPHYAGSYILEQQERMPPLQAFELKATTANAAPAEPRGRGEPVTATLATSSTTANADAGAQPAN